MIFHTSAPGNAAWDDLGVAEVTCHINIGLPQCLRQFRTEACRMGGDIVYDLPEQPLRPKEQAVVYRGRVAHTRPPAPRKENGKEIQRENPTRDGAHPPPPEPTVAPPPTDAGVVSERDR